MRFSWQKFFLPVLLGVLLAGCTVASPITTLKGFLNSLQAKQYDQAAALLVMKSDDPSKPLRTLTDEEKKDWKTRFEQDFGALSSFTTQNTVPLNNDQLKELGAAAGYEVYYRMEFTKQAAKNLKGYAVQLDDGDTAGWKLYLPDFELDNNPK